jgi:hypothetical protein
MTKQTLKKALAVFQLVAVTLLYTVPAAQTASAQALVAKAVDDNYQVEVGESFNFNVLDNDTPNPGAFFMSAGSANDSSLGALQNNGDGKFTFTANQEGTYTFDYTMYCNTANGPSTDSATVTIEVGGGDTNEPQQCTPTAINDNYQVSVNSTKTFNVLDNDTDGGNSAIIFVSAGSPNNSNLGDLTNNGDGSFSFDAEQEGTYTFNYTIGCAGSTEADQGTVTIEIEDDVIVPGSCSITLLASPTQLDVSDPLTLEWITEGSTADDATVRIGSQDDTRDAFNFTTDNLDGSRTNSGPATVGDYQYIAAVKCADGKIARDTSDVIVKTIDNNQCNPIAVNDSYSVQVGNQIDNIQPLQNDSPSDAIFFSAGSPNDSSLGNLTYDSRDDSFSFDAQKIGTYTFNYTIGCAGSTEADQGTVTIKIEDDFIGVTCELVAIDDNYQVKVGDSYSFDVLTNDFNRGTKELVFVSVGSPNDNSLANLNNQGNGKFMVQTLKTGTYTFNYTIGCAGSTEADQGTVTIEILKDNVDVCSAVNAQNDSYRIGRNNMQILDVLSNDSTASDDEPLEIEQINIAPRNGNASIVNNRIQYTPNSGFQGSDSFTYRAENDCGRVDEATVSITVGSNNNGGGGGGGGGGGILDPIDRDRDRGEVEGDDEVNLDIFNERLTKLSDSKFVVTWNTNVPASSQVVYGMRSVSDPRGECGESDLGYQQSTSVKTNRTTTHVMIVDGLTPGAQYFFRPVSDRDDADCETGRELTYRPVNICEGYIKDFLRIGQYNDPREVVKLQAFLRIYEGANVRITGNFDASTDAAVKDFQAKYYEEVLQPWGYDRDEATGYVYITTRNKINEIICERDIPFTDAQLSEIANFRSYWNNRFQTTPVATQPLFGDAKGGGSEADLLPETDDDTDVVIIGGTDTIVGETIADDEFFLDTVSDDELSAEAEIAQKSLAASAAGGILSFIFSLPFLLTVLGLLVLLLIYEVIKDRKAKKDETDVVVVADEPAVPTKTN